MKYIPSAILVLFLSLSFNCSTPEPEAVSDSWTEDEVVNELRNRLERARDKFIQLAEAVPEDEWDYRPMEGTRSFGEVFIHIAADNWAPSFAGLEVDFDIPVEATTESIMEYQAEAIPKADTIKELEASFEYLLISLEASRGEMDRVFLFFGNEWELGNMWIALTTHMHEHLGQSIAYARANEIVPPWSRDN